MDNIMQLQSDRERRIKERRRRIQERLQTLRQGGASTQADGESRSHAVGPGLQQVLESTRRVMDLKRETTVAVNVVPIDSELAENWRRGAEEKRKQGLRSRMLEEAEDSARKNAAVAMHWADLFTIDVPQDLWNAMQAQKADCDSIINSKTQLIAQIKKDLKTMDNDFAKLLKQQMDDMNSMLKAMGDQLDGVSVVCRHELDEVEMAYVNERKGQLEHNKDEMQELFDRRNQLEQEFLERYLSLVSGYQSSLFEMQGRDAQDFNTLKLQLETDRQHLERHMEAMLATYQLNIEKLDYNYRVLVERDHENSATINQQKRKIARQRDQLASLKSRYFESDRKFHEENMKLTSEYKRITEQFKDLQLKFKHFELSDSRKYTEVWKMKEEQVVQLAKRLVAADQVLHEQQLGLAWQAPNEEVFMSPYAMDSTAQDMQRDDATAAEMSAGTDLDEVALAKQQALEAMRNLRGDPRFDASFGPKPLVCTKVYQHLRRPVAFLSFELACRFKPAMDMITDEAGFLLEQAVRKHIETLPADDQGNVRFDSLLEVLGVADCAGLQALMEALDPSSDVELRAKGMGTSEKPPARSTPFFVSADDVVRRLRAFVEAENASIQGGAPKANAPGPKPGVSRRVLESEQEFWRKVAKVVDERGKRVFSSLESNLQKYLGLLKRRENALRSVEHAGQQNVELRALLNQYLSSKINTELQIPPTQLI